MKKVLCFILTLCVIPALSACGKTKALHCDSCGKEVTVNEHSDMEESWLIYCNTCHDELFGDDPILGDN